MSKQRRKRMNRNKRTRSRRSSIRIGIEQLDQRALPGGFLDVFAGAAVASTFDLLPEEQLVPEEIQSESDVLTLRERVANNLMRTSLSLPSVERETNDSRVELRASGKTEFGTTSESTGSADTLLVNSFVDAFYATNQLVDTTAHLSQSPLASTPTRSFSSPISQLGAGVGSGSGQGYNVTGAELPQSNVSSAAPIGSSLPAWMVGEGEGPASASASASASSSASASGTASASGSGSNSAPEADEGWDMVLHDQQLFSSASGDDLDGDPLTFSVTSGTSNGTLNFSSDGTFDYTPNAGYVGSDSFDFEVSDGTDTDSATFTIDVYNTEPNADDGYEMVLHDQQLFSSVYGDDSDGDPLTFSVTAGPSSGALNFNSDGTYDYTPNTLFVGSDSFDFEVDDGLATASATVYIDVYNTAPDAQDDNYMLGRNTVLNVSAGEGVLTNDSDSDGDSITASLIIGPANANSFTFNSDGSFDYEPTLGYVGTDSFVYEVTDGIDTTQATAYLDVYNSEPVWDPLSYGDLYGEDYDPSYPAWSGLAIGQLNAVDPDGDTLTYNSSSPGYFNIQSDGLVTISSIAGLVGYFDTSDSLTVPVTVSDGIATVASEFVLSKGGFIDQSQIWLKTSTGAVHEPATADELNAILIQMQADGETIDTLIIKGHASEDGIEVGDGDDWLVAPNNGNNVFIGDDDMTQVLKDVTDGNSDISLRGCFSHKLAERVEARLDGAEVKGAVRFVIGIPGTTWGIGVYP